MTDTSFDYGESDDWVWGYGNQQRPNEYVINISGGGDGVSPNGFENWVIKKVGGELKCYIRHGGDIPDKEQINKIIVSCPDGNYVSFQDKDYVFREGEICMDWLEEELGETDKRMITMIDNLSRANEFLQKISEEQTKKIKEQEKEILSLMSLREGDSLKLATLHNEKEELGVMADAYGTLKSEYERLQKDNKESQILLHTHNNQVTDCEKEINKLQAEVEGAGSHLDELVDENNQLKEEAVENKKLFDTTFGEVMKLRKENEKLKEELDESNDKTIELIDEKKKLRKENKKLNTLLKIEKEECENYKLYFYSIEGGCAGEVKIVTNPDKVKEIKDKGGGSLMFPTEYRKLDKDDILWDEVREKYELKGRWEAYCHTGFEGLKPKQNKDIKYKHPHFVDKDWDGAYNDGVETWNKYVTNYVYGDVYLLKL